MLLLKKNYSILFNRIAKVRIRSVWERGSENVINGQVQIMKPVILTYEIFKNNPEALLQFAENGTGKRIVGLF